MLALSNKKYWGIFRILKERGASKRGGFPGASHTSLVLGPKVFSFYKKRSHQQLAYPATGISVMIYENICPDGFS